MKTSMKNSYHYRRSCLRILLPCVCAVLILGGILCAILFPLLNISKTSTIATTVGSPLITSITTPNTFANPLTASVSTTTTSFTTSTTTTSLTTSTTTTSSTASTTTTSFTTSTTESTITTTTMTTTTTTQKICITDLTLLAGTNETIYPIWNTFVGGNTSISTSGSGTSIGNYYFSEIPQYIFDQSATNKYTNFGSCTSSTYSFSCGINTGVYFTLQRGASLLLAIQFQAPYDLPTRDPLTITIEGSNQSSSSALMLGSSWSLIYNGSSGLDVDPGRYNDGIVQYIPNNVNWYTSYRLLVTSKRNSSTSVQCGEVRFFGY